MLALPQYTESGLREAILSTMLDWEKESPENILPIVKHHVWIENGTWRSAWVFSDGTITGDKGYEEFCRIFNSEINKMSC